jgi:hypothetical protein
MFNKQKQSFLTFHDYVLFPNLIFIWIINELELWIFSKVRFNKELYLYYKSVVLTIHFEPQ